jgi:hypothetical protein
MITGLDKQAANRFAGWSPRRRILVFVLLPVLLCCCGAPIGGAVYWVGRETIDAGKGAPSPDAAADIYIGSLGYGQENWLWSNAHRDARQQLSDQWHTYRAAMDAEVATMSSEGTASVDLSWSGLSVGPIVEGRATVKVDVRAEWSLTDHRSQVHMWNGNYLPWTIETVDDDGWRVTRVTAPPWCGTAGYVTQCGSEPAPLTSSPSPSPSPSGDSRQHLRDMLRCGSDDPFREWHSCPAPS